MSYTDRAPDGSYLREDDECGRCAELERDLARERERTTTLREALDRLLVASYTNGHADLPSARLNAKRAASLPAGPAADAPAGSEGKTAT